MNVSRTCSRIAGASHIGIRNIPKVPRFTSTAFVRSKVTLPDLPYDYGALEPSISGKIMEIHHQNHHQTYVNGLNAATEQLQDAISRQDIAGQISLQTLIKFHGGGHVNHSLFWQNLAPNKNGGGGQPEGDLMKAIKDSFTSFAIFKAQFTTALAGIQGSGWGWLVKDNETGSIQIRTYANQDPVVGKYTPLLGIDAWEHAYYLQYQNRKVEYFNRIWNVINWKTVEQRFNSTGLTQSASN